MLQPNKKKMLEFRREILILELIDRKKLMITTIFIEYTLWKKVIVTHLAPVTNSSGARNLERDNIYNL